MTTRGRIWWRATLSVFNGLHELNLGLIAAGVAFYSMLAVFPAVAAIIALWGLVSDPAIVEDQLDLMRNFIPSAAFTILDKQVTQLIYTTSSTLGWTTVLSTGAALWTSRAGVAGLIRGLNAIYRVNNRATLWQMVVALNLTLMLIGVALVALATVVIGPIVLMWLPLGPLADLFLTALRWVIAIVVVMMGLGLIYRYGPAGQRANRPRWFTPGAVVAVVIWGLASYGFSLYLTNFGKYNEIYGALGAVVALLMWFYISAYVVLLGASLNAELRRERRKANLSEINPSPVSPVAKDNDMQAPL